MVAYTQYDVELENRRAFNAFDLTRGYININGQLSNRVRFRFTPDVRRVTDGSMSGSLMMRVKYAFVQLDTIGPARSWVRFGAHQTPWLDFEENINRAFEEASNPWVGDYRAAAEIKVYKRLVEEA